uniref:Uncharacterized protein n=1 Tax=Branchiostoma floridae TaxID=7739 RepID=C3ZLT9_BRAFL|eukprot:XP_002590551.1 hypothetical protein BRAFLDRAFT_86231 [Branchiostoma floridae]
MSSQEHEGAPVASSWVRRMSFGTPYPIERIEMANVMIIAFIMTYSQWIFSSLMSRPERWPIRIRITTASAYKRGPTAADTKRGGVAEPAPWNVDGLGGTRGMHGVSKQDDRGGTRDMSGDGKGGKGEPPQNTEDMVLTAMVRVLEEAFFSGFVY